MLQKIPLHVASAEANLKETIRKSVFPPTVDTQPTSTGSTSSSRKRKLSKNTDQNTPSPSVTKRKRIRVDSSRAAQQQLPSPKSSRDSLLTQGGLSVTNQHRTVGDALQSGATVASRSVNTAQTPGHRSSTQPPTPRMLPITPSRPQLLCPSETSAQPTGPSSLSHKKAAIPDNSVTPLSARPASSAHSAASVPSYLLNYPKDAFKVPGQFHIHTPLRTGSRPLNRQLTKPSAPLPPSVGFSAVRHRSLPFPWACPHHTRPSSLHTETREALHSNYR